MVDFDPVLSVSGLLYGDKGLGALASSHGDILEIPRAAFALFRVSCSSSTHEKSPAVEGQFMVCRSVARA